MSLYRVTLPEAPDGYATWDILPRLTDARGELQDDAMDFHAFHELLEDAAHLRRLQSDLDGAFGRVAVKDGTFGVLYEAVLQCPRQQVSAKRVQCITLLQALKQRVPSLDVAIAPEWMVPSDTGVCVWVFARERSLTPEQVAMTVSTLMQQLSPIPSYAEAA